VKSGDVKSALWAKVDAPSIDPSAYDVRQVWYSSKDGTKIPMFVVGKKGIEKNGKNPTLLTGYGGFNVSLTPGFSRSCFSGWSTVASTPLPTCAAELSLAKTGTAPACSTKAERLRRLHRRGEYLIAQKYTDRDHLAIEGGSNGGLLMGAMITQRPDLFRAVVCAVPLLDMLRYQNFQIASLGSGVRLRRRSKAVRLALRLLALPSRKGRRGVSAILFMTGDTDTRVDPMHAKKMARSHCKPKPRTAPAKISPSCCASRPKPDTARASRLPSKSKRARICIRSYSGSWG